MTASQQDQLVVMVPSAMKEALGNYSAEHDQPMTETVKEAIAAYIGIDYVKQPRTRTPKFATPEEEKSFKYGRAALIRWGRATASRLLNAGEIEAATVIARALEDKDYETLGALKSASEAEPEEEEVIDEGE